MGRPARKTDGYRLKPPRHHGSRWEDANVGKWVAFKFLPACLIAGSIALLAVAIMRGDGVDVSKILPRFGGAYTVLSTGGGGLIIGLLGIFKDRHAPHLASLQIDSADNSQRLGEVDGKVVELSKLSGAMTRAIQDTRSDVTAARSDVADVRREVSQLVGAITQIQMLLVSRATPQTSLYPPATQPATQPHVQVADAHTTGSSVAAHAASSRPDPFDTTRPWVREDTGVTPAVRVMVGDELPAPVVDMPGQQRSAFELAQERYAYGETGTIPTPLPDLPAAEPMTDPQLDEHLRGGPDLYRDYYRDGGRDGSR